MSENRNNIQPEQEKEPVSEKTEIGENTQGNGYYSTHRNKSIESWGREKDGAHLL